MPKKRESRIIKQIDLLVHPFYALWEPPSPNSKEPMPKANYGPEQAKTLKRIWWGHIDEVAADPNRLMFPVPYHHHGFPEGEILEARAQPYRDGRHHPLCAQEAGQALCPLY